MASLIKWPTGLQHQENTDVLEATVKQYETQHWLTEVESLIYQS